MSKIVPPTAASVSDVANAARQDAPDRLLGRRADPTVVARTTTITSFWAREIVGASIQRIPHL
ncbi:hypothetical protein [Methylobacterium sp.]|uniref:hypothetical protein n=1 Tax=Methylobacterium sp. TaxID=409 RepID=UPI00257A1FBE|nr:hypothetical protein [Methylobacterium sp.]